MPMGENNNQSTGSEGTEAIKSEMRPVVSPVLPLIPSSGDPHHLMTPSPQSAVLSSPPVLQSSSASAILSSSVSFAAATPHLNPYTSQVQNGLPLSQQSVPQSQSHLQQQHQHQLQQQSHQQNFPSAIHSSGQHQQQQQQQHSTVSPPVMYTSADYLAQLLKDQKQVSAFPGVFFHLERLLNEEINRVRSTLFQINGSEKKPLLLPEADGPVICKSDKILVPIDKHPEYNFVGRILGPRGMTAKQLEHETGCKIMVRGKGSMRDRKKEDQNRGKPNWEHLNEPLHVLITCEDTANRADVKLMRAREEVEKLLVPVADGEDDLKKRQLMELAIINGTYRDSGSKQQQNLESEAQLKSMHMPMMRHPGLGAPLIINPQHLLAQHLMNGHPSLLSQHHADPGTLYYTNPFDFGRQYAHNLLAAASAPHLLEFQAQTSPSDQLAAATGKQRRSVLLTTNNVREHPYQRPAKTT